MTKIDLSLSKLNLSENQISLKALDRILKYSRNHESLKSIHLDRTKLNDEAIDVFSNHFDHENYLESLSINYNEFTDSFGQKFCEILLTNATLKKLQVKSKLMTSAT